MTTTTRYLTDAEVIAAAMNRLRLRHGLSATPDLHPDYWRVCMIIAEGAAVGGALELLAVRDDAHEIARKSAPVRTGRPARVYSRRVAGSGVRWA